MPTRGTSPKNKDPNRSNLRVMVMQFDFYLYFNFNLQFDLYLDLHLDLHLDLDLT